MPAFDITCDGARPRGIGTIDPGRYAGCLALLQIPAVARWDLDGLRDVIGHQSPFEFLLAADVWLLDEIARAFKITQILAALGRAVEIECGIGQILDVERYAVSDDDQQDRTAKKGKCQAM